MSAAAYWDTGPGEPSRPALKFKVKKKLVPVVPISPIPCTLCKKPFYQYIHLQQHSRCHSGARPFQCHSCSRSFMQLRHLQKHRLVKHESRKKCLKCGRKFPRWSVMLHHIIQMHGLKSLSLPKLSKLVACEEEEEKSMKLPIKLCIKKDLFNVAEDSKKSSWSVKKKKKHKKHKKDSRKIKQCKESSRRSLKMEESKPRIILKFKMPIDNSNLRNESTETTNDRGHTVSMQKPIVVSTASQSKSEQFTEIVQSPSPKDSGIDDCSPLHETDHTDNCSSNAAGGKSGAESSNPKSLKQSSTSSISSSSSSSSSCSSSTATVSPRRPTRQDAALRSLMSAKDRTSLKDVLDIPRDEKLAKHMRKPSSHCIKQEIDSECSSISDIPESASMMDQDYTVPPSPSVPTLKITISKKPAGKLRARNSYTSSLHVSSDFIPPVSPYIGLSKSPRSSPASPRLSKRQQSPATSAAPRLIDSPKPVYMTTSAATADSSAPSTPTTHSPRQEKRAHAKSPAYSRMESSDTICSSSQASSYATCSPPHSLKSERDFAGMLNVDVDDDPYAFDDDPCNSSPHLLPYTSTLPRPRSDKYKLDPPILEPQVMPFSQMLPTDIKQSRPKLTKQTDVKKKRVRKSPVRTGAPKTTKEKKRKKLTDTVLAGVNNGLNTVSSVQEDLVPKLESNISCEGNQQINYPDICNSGKTNETVVQQDETKVSLQPTKSLGFSFETSPTGTTVPDQATNPGGDISHLSSQTDHESPAAAAAAAAAVVVQDQSVDKHTCEQVKENAVATDVSKDETQSAEHKSEDIVSAEDGLASAVEERIKVDHIKSAAAVEVVVGDCSASAHHTEEPEKTAPQSAENQSCQEPTAAQEVEAQQVKQSEAQQPAAQEEAQQSASLQTEAQLAEHQQMEVSTAETPSVQPLQEHPLQDPEQSQVAASPALTLESCNLPVLDAAIPANLLEDEGSPPPVLTAVTSEVPCPVLSSSNASSEETAALLDTQAQIEDAVDSALDDSDLLLSDPHLENLSFNDSFLDLADDDNDNPSNDPNSDDAIFDNLAAAAATEADIQSKKKIDSDPIVVTLPGEAGMEPMSLVIDNDDSDHFGESDGEFDLASSLPSIEGGAISEMSSSTLPPPTPIVKQQVCGATVDTDSEFAELQAAYSAIDPIPKPPVTGFFDAFANFVGANQSKSSTGAQQQGYSSEFAKFLSQKESCVVDETLSGGKSEPEENLKLWTKAELEALGQSYEQVHRLCEDIISFLRCVFPGLDLPAVGGSNPCAIEQLMMQIEDMIADKEETTSGTGSSSSNTKDNNGSTCYEPLVSVCSQPALCLPHLRNKLCELLLAMLPDLYLPATFDRAGPEVDTLLKHVLESNVT